MEQTYSPPTFTDSKGRNWDLTITLAAAQRIDSCDFSELLEDEISFLEPSKQFFELLLNKTSLQFAIIWCIVKPQADAVGIDQNAFCELIGPHQLTPAKQALWRAVTDFFPHLRTSLVRLGQLHEAHLKQVDEKLAEVANRLEGVSSQEIDRAMQKLESELAAMRGTTFTGLPPTPASATGGPVP